MRVWENWFAIAIFAMVVRALVLFPLLGRLGAGREKRPAGR